MAAVPRFTIPYASPDFVGLPRRPAAAILRLPRLWSLTPVAPDRREGRRLAATAPAAQDIAAGWAVVLALAVVGFVLF